MMSTYKDVVRAHVIARSKEAIRHAEKIGTMAHPNTEYVTFTPGCLWHKHNRQQFDDNPGSDRTTRRKHLRS